MKSIVLYGERKAFYDTKTTCFAVVETATYRLSVFCLWLKGTVTCHLHHLSVLWHHHLTIKADGVAMLRLHMDVKTGDGSDFLW